MILGLMSSIGFSFLSYGRLSPYISVPLALLIFYLIGVAKHEHSSLFVMEVLSSKSPLRSMNPIFKLLYSFSIIVLTVALKSEIFSLAVLSGAIFMVVVINRVPIHYYLSIMRAPLIFILLSGIGVMLTVSTHKSGFLDLKFGGYFLSITKEAQREGLNIFLLVTASVSELISIGISTGMGDIIFALKKLKCPKTLIESMYLIYRYIFLLSRLLNNMQISGEARGGFEGLKNTLRTSKYIAARLFNKSIGFSLSSYDAMQSRLYTGDMAFIERDYSGGGYYPIFLGFFAILLLIIFGVIL